MKVNQPEPVLRLAKVIRERRDAHGSYSKLARAIQEVNRAEKPPLDRRKLRRIVDHDETVTLDMREIRALDRYLVPFGEGLADRPLLVRRSLLSSLSAKDDVKMLLGTYPRREHRSDVSRWDLRALCLLQSALGQFHPRTKSNIDDVLLPGEFETSPESRAQFEHYLHDDKELSVCLIGAPRSNPASEGALAGMFELEPFIKTLPQRLPFHFIWTPNARGPYASAFALEADDIVDRDPALAEEIRNEDAWALLAEGELYRVLRDKEFQTKSWKSYGVVVAQRRQGGQVWLVVAGLTGPATYAAALAVAREETGTLPEAPDDEQVSKICWSLVEASIEVDETVPGDNRKVTDARVLLTRICDSKEAREEP